MNDEQLQALGRHVAERTQQAALVGEGEHAALRAALLARVRFGRARLRLPRRWIAAIGVAALLAGAFVAFVASREPAPLEFEVGAQARPGAIPSWMSAPDAKPLPLRFSDGTRVTLAPGARARVSALTAAGAEIVLEEGRARLDVMPRRASRWRVRSGPFAVLVTGTRFDVEWHPDRDAFRLELAAGHVTITGCVFEDGLSLRAGQQVEASCRRHELRIGPLVQPLASAGEADRAGSQSAATSAKRGAMPDAERARAETQPQPVEPNAAAARALPLVRPLASAPSHRVAPLDSWAELARAGRYDEAYAAAERRGPGAMQPVDPETALLFADVARLTQHTARAREAYLAVRARFAGTQAAALAAFYLARLDLDQRGDAAASERWLERYLDEQPDGALAPSALGRLMEVLARQGKLSAARASATRYLALHVQGPYADSARRLLADTPRTR